MDFLRSSGIEIESYLRELGLPPDPLREQDLLISERQIWELLERVREREGMPDIGFRLGASHHVTDIENLGPLLSGHPTLLRTIEAFCRLLRTHNNTWSYWVEERADGVRICRRSSPIDIGQWPIEQYVVSYLVDLARMAAPATWWPQEIWLQHDGRLLPEEEAWLRPSRIHSGSRLTAISVPTELLSRRPRAERQLRPAFEAEPISGGFAAISRELIRTSLVGGRPQLAEFAASVGLHPRAAQRQLKREGTSFQRLLDQARLDLARTRLEDGRQPIAEIATDLGFRHAPAFTRSFRRWTGVTPRDYRRANRRPTG